MVDFKLDADEGIVLQTTEAGCYYGDDELELNDLVLTNKNIIYSYEKSNGLFSKPETIVEKKPLSSIKVVNGVVQVQQVNDDDYGKTLQILYKNGRRELIELYDSPKKEYPKWQEAISNLVISICSTDNCKAEKKENIHMSNAETTSSFDRTVRFCSYCGTKLDTGARFCKNCGEAVLINTQHTSTPPKEKVVNKETPIKENPTERKTVYEGKIYKCPNCGEVMKSFSANCPSCGFEIRGSRATTSVQEFAMKLEQIEQKQMPHFEEKSSVMKMVFGKDFKGDDYDIQQAKRDFEKRRKSEKASLISSFPIPNTKEDILEFLLLASSNIDVKTTHDIVTQAWLQKLEQVYQRAQITIRNTNEFKQVKFIYDSKQKELGKQKTNKKNKILGGVALIAAGILLYIIGMMLGESTGDSDSSLYSICMAGFFVMFGGIFLLLSTIPNKD